MRLLRTLSLLALAGVAAACQDAPPTTPQGPAATPEAAAPASQDVRTGWIYAPDGTPMEVTFAVRNGWAIYQGDINLGRADQVARNREELVRASGPRYGVFIDGSTYRWPGGTVPYVISNAFTASQQQTILNALNHIAGKSAGVTFTPRTSQTSYLVFAPHTSECSSYVGRQGNAQTINLTGGCAGSMGTVVHEALHALGLWHEQSRCDRDSYVIINSGNVSSGNLHNFDKKCTGATDVFGYDEGSIMHYGPYAFSGNGQPTITSRRGLDHLMGQRSGMSVTDVNTIRYIYPSPVGVSISGPSSITQAGTYTWTAVVTGGNGFYTYKWEAYDGNAWYLKGTASSWSGSFAWNSGAFRAIRVTVTSGSWTATATMNVTVSIAQPAPTVYIDGESYISAKSTYTFTAVYSNATSPGFSWSERWCSSVTGCTAWSGTTGTSQTYNRVLGPENCPSGESRTFELRVVLTRPSDGQTAQALHAAQLCPGSIEVA